MSDKFRLVTISAHEKIRLTQSGLHDKRKKKGNEKRSAIKVKCFREFALSISMVVTIQGDSVYEKIMKRLN